MARARVARAVPGERDDMNFKRNKPRRKVRCNHCTPHRLGNSGKAYSVHGGEGPSVADRRAEADLDDEISEARAAWPPPSQEARAAAAGRIRTK